MREVEPTVPLSDGVPLTAVTLYQPWELIDTFYTLLKHLPKITACGAWQSSSACILYDLLGKAEFRTTLYSRIALIGYFAAQGFQSINRGARKVLERLAAGKMADSSKQSTDISEIN